MIFQEPDYPAVEANMSIMGGVFHDERDDLFYNVAVLLFRFAFTGLPEGVPQDVGKLSASGYDIKILYLY